ncbi:MAG: hypothetical protein JEZ02_20575 [Desulfatibacillum sp.]|nr:hypothetical protein [Desulfatibacillum sp.]
MKKISVGIVILTLVIGSALAGGQLFVNHQAEIALEERLAEVKDKADVQCDKVSVNIFTGVASFQGLKMVTESSPAPVLVDEVIVHSFRWGQGNPNQQHFEVIGIKPGANAEAYFPNSPMNVDLAKISWDLECDYDYNPEHQTLDVNKLRMAEAQCGVFDMEFHLANLNLPQTPPSSDQMALLTIKLLFQAKIVGASLTYEDRALFQLALEKAAREHNKSVDQIRKELGETIKAQMKINQSPALAPILEQVQAFINNPEKLTIRLSPPEPIGMQAIQAAKTVDEKIRILGLEVKA